MRTERLELSHRRHWLLRPACLPFHHVRSRRAETYTFRVRKFKGLVAEGCKHHCDAVLKPSSDLYYKKSSEVRDGK